MIAILIILTVIEFINLTLLAVLVDNSIKIIKFFENKLPKRGDINN